MSAIVTSLCTMSHRISSQLALDIVERLTVDLTRV